MKTLREKKFSNETINAFVKGHTEWQQFMIKENYPWKQDCINRGLNQSVFVDVIVRLY